MRSGSGDKARKSRAQTSLWYFAVRMILVTASKTQRILYFKYVGKVTVAEVRSRIDEVRDMLPMFTDGFRLLGDFEHLDSMEKECALEIGHMMDLLKSHGLELVARIMPDQHKDIGLNILSVFHYGRGMRIVTCPNTSEAFQLLKL